MLPKALWKPIARWSPGPRYVRETADIPIGWKKLDPNRRRMIENMSAGNPLDIVNVRREMDTIIIPVASNLPGSRFSLKWPTTGWNMTLTM